MEIRFRYSASCACAFVLALLLASNSALAAKKAPTAEEIKQLQEMLGGSSPELEEALKNLDPETVKQLEGFTPKSPAAGGQSKDPPARERATAAKPPKVDRQPLSPQKLKAYVDTLQGKLDKALQANRLERARSVEAALPKGDAYLPNLRAAANGLAVAGFWPEATWLMGRLAQASGDAGDLNNLAAFVTMQGAPAPALPILHTLDSRYPDNSTLLNNLGQAYFQLGAADEAERYLAAAVRVAPTHPQANVTRAVMFKAKGDKAGAQVALKMALDGGYAPSKVTQLRKAGAKWQAKPSNWRMPMPKDPLGLERFVLPHFPMDVESLVKAVPIWAQFHGELRTMRDQLDAQRTGLMQGLQGPEYQKKVLAGMMNMPFSGLATEVMSGLQPQSEQTLKRATEAVANALVNEATRRNALMDKLEAMETKNDKTYATDTAAAEAHRCDGVPKAYASYLQAGNPELENTQTTYLEALRKSINERTYFMQFLSPTTDDFVVAKLGAKLEYVQALLNTQVALAGLTPGERRNCLERSAGKGGSKLSDFDDIHCQYVVSFQMGPLGDMTFRCNTSEANFNPGFSPFEFAWKIRSTGKSDEWEFVSASAAVEIDGVKVKGHGEFDEKGLKSGGVSAETGVGETKIKGGPLQVGVEATVKIGVEIDRGGVTDVIVTAGVEGKASGKAIDTKDGGLGKAGAKVGAEGSWGWSAGPGGETSGGVSASVLNL